MAGLKGSRWFLLAAGLVAGAGVITITRSGLARPDPAVVTVPVERGPFHLYLTGSARLDARQSVTLASDLPSNTAKLVWLVPEGTFVSTGEPVARFDPAPFEADVRKLERDLVDARALLAQGEAELQLQLQGGAEARAAADQAIAAAALRQRQLAEAERPLRVAQARNDVVTARAGLQRAREERAAQLEMFEGGFGSRALLEEAAAAEAEAENKLAFATQAVEVLERVSLPAELEQAGMDLASRRREREHLEQSNLQLLAKLNAAQLRTRSAVEDLAATLEQARQRLGQTELLAPVSGFVVYKPIAVNGETRKAQVGDSLWQRHGFMVIPDMAALVATVNVPEQELGRVEPGQDVRLEPEAFPGLALGGRVETVGMLAAGGGADNLFEVRIAVDGVDPRLRPGMRARARILTGSFSDALRVPVEAVFYEDGAPVCFVWRWGGPRRQSLTLGASDGSFVIVQSGLSAGERLLLVPPVAAGGSG